MVTAPCREMTIGGSQVLRIVGETETITGESVHSSIGGRVLREKTGSRGGVQPVMEVLRNWEENGETETRGKLFLKRIGAL